jgi:uncharacterized protein (DUF2147 family)
MKTKFKILLIMIFLGISALNGFSQHNLFGSYWLTQDKEAKIKFDTINGLVFGKIVWLKSPYDNNGNPVKDNNNPNKLQKNRELMGLSILKNLEFNGKEWINGTLYDPTDGGTYKCKMWFENGNLKVRGYLGFLYETETWIKTTL